MQPQYQRTPEALSKLYLRSAQGRAGAARFAWCARSRQTGPLSINHFGQLPAVTVSFNLQPGFSLGEAAQQVDDAIREMRMPATISASFQGTVKEFQNSFAQPVDPADRRDPGDLHRAGHAVRELHSPDHDSLRPALGGLRRAADAADLPQGTRSLRLRRHHHAVRRGEEERHHDDRFRHRRAAARAAAPTTPSGKAACCASAPS